jgi:glycosyltransferase involved in cell wall biosynthesis
MRIQIVDPSAYTPPYDHALCAALARAGADVTLVTSDFAYGAVPPAVGYTTNHAFYRHARGAPGSRLRVAAKLAEHVPDMVRYRRQIATQADVVHFQWLSVQPLDVHLLPRRPLVLTAHDLLPREPRPGQVRAQRRLYDAVDAVIVHSQHGRERLLTAIGLPPGKVHVVPHGALTHLTAGGDRAPLPPQLARVDKAVVLFFGLIRPYKGLDLLLEAFNGIDEAELWVVGRARFDTSPLKAAAPRNVRFVERFVSDAELPAYFERADVVVLPYRRTERFDQSGVLFAALAFGKAVIVTDVGGFGEVAAAGAARLVQPDDAHALHAALKTLIADPDERHRLETAAAAAAAGPYSWDEAARRTLEVYARVHPRESRP